MVYLMQNLETKERVFVEAINEIDALSTAIADTAFEDRSYAADKWIVADEYQTEYYLQHEKEIQAILFPKEQKQ